MKRTIKVKKGSDGRRAHDRNIDVKKVEPKSKSPMYISVDNINESVVVRSENVKRLPDFVYFSKRWNETFTIKIYEYIKGINVGCYVISSAKGNKSSTISTAFVDTCDRPLEHIKRDIIKKLE